MDSIKEKLTNKLHIALNNGTKDEKIYAYLKLAFYEYNHKNFESSKRNFKKILELNPNEPKINYYLSLIELNDNNIESAKNYLTIENKNNPENYDSKNLLEKLQIHTNIPIITITIAVLCIITYIFTFPTPNFIELLKYGLSSFNIQISTIITSIFLHANIYHLILNILILILFGLYLEKYIGSLKFLMIFLSSAVVGNFVEIYFTTTQSFVIGISAGLFGILGAIVLREPLLNIRLFGIIKIPIIIFFGAVFLINWLLGYFSSQNQILLGEMAHIFGFLTGVLIIGISQRETISVFYNWLVMAFGFTILTYGFTRTINLITNYNTNELLIATTMYLMGTFLIFYSFMKLKISNRLKSEISKKNPEVIK